MSESQEPSTSLNKELLLKQWRYRIFASTWLCYAGMYFCRKPFSVVKGPMGDAYGWDAAFLGKLGAIYLLTYAIGQFLSGMAGTVFGPRRVLLLGMGGSVLANVVFGFTDSEATFAILLGLLGFAQSTGWGNTVGSMGTWFRKEERGRVMGIWATCYQVGGIGATALASKVLGVYGFQYTFFAGSLVMLAVMAFFAFNHQDRPEDLGLSLDQDVNTKLEEDSNSVSGHFQSLGWDIKTKLTIAIVGIFYFFVKFIRYALLSWVPYLLYKNYPITAEKAGYISMYFEIFGVVGVIAAGWMSDKLFGSRRTGISIVFLIGMFISCFALYSVGQTNLLIFGVCISFVGFFLFGPDALMTGAAAQDIGNERGATLSAGIINGVGAFGAVTQELVIGEMYDSSGGDVGPIFLLLVGSAFAAAFCLFILRVTKLSDV